MQLAKISDQFKDVGVNIAAMTYDSVEMLKSVEEDEGIEFTLLKDTDISHVNALGILNEDYEPGSRAYGVPHPGIFIITPDGVIRAKFAEEGFRARPDFDNVLEAAAHLELKDVSVVNEARSDPRFPFFCVFPMKTLGKRHWMSPEDSSF